VKRVKKDKVKGVSSGLLILSIIVGVLACRVHADEEYHVIATLQAPIPTNDGKFGLDLTLFEDILLVAESHSDLEDLIDTRNAYMFDSDWNVVTTIKQPNPEVRNTFSTSVDVWGNTLAIQNLMTVEDIELAGKVNIYDSEGAFITNIQSPEPYYHGDFGAEVCLYKDILLVGEIYTKDEGLLWAGFVQVFNSEGDFIRTIHSPSPKSSGSFGSSIDANDDFILISEFGDLTQKPLENSSVYVYNRNYELVETLHSPDHQERSYFGISLAISSDNLVVGEHWASVEGHERAGRAHIYDNNWNHVATLQSPTPEENGEFGIHVDIGGGLVVVGERKGDAVTMNEGKAYVFDLDGNLVASLVSPEPEVGAQFGWRVATDGEIVVVADVFHSVDGVSRAGKVNVFQRGSADFAVDDLSIDPTSVNKGKTVTVSVDCINTGTVSGEYQVVLTINGVVEDEKIVTIGPDETTVVSFEVTAGEAGEYSVDVNGLTGSYTVKGIIPGFPLESIIISMVLAVLVLWLIQRNR
jgi:hypothetical protein